MADSVTQTPTTGTDYTKYQKAIEEAAARTRDVQGVSDETKAALDQSVGQLSTSASPTMTTAQRPGGYGVVNTMTPPASSTNLAGVGESLVSNLGTQEADLKKQAESTASALEIAGSAQLQGAQNIEGIQESLRTTAGRAAESFGAAGEKADEYVKAARGRVQEVLSKVDSIYEEIKTSNDFAKAHDMQSAVQASLGSMRSEERNIAQVYGPDSAEAQQFKMQKSGALATVQSNIHASYANLKSQMDTTYLGTVSDAYTKSNTAVSYQEQQHVEMLKYQAQSESAYALKVAELDTTLEQMKTAGLEGLANWILQTPTFSMDVTSVTAAISDLLTTQETLNQAGQLNQAQTDLTSAQAGQAKTWANYMAGGKKPYGG